MWFLSAVVDGVDGDVLHVFATGTDVRSSWWRAAVSRVR
jgi:hypothetical protein